MTTSVPPPPKVAPTSAPGVHEIATFLPGRLEFEHELDNEAEDLVKDLEFGMCYAWDGDQIVEDENDADIRARSRMQEERKSLDSSRNGSQLPPKGVNGIVSANGHHPMNGDSHVKSEEPSAEQQGSSEDDANAEEATLPPPFETEDSLAFKLTLLEMYNQRVDKRREAKAIMYQRGLLEYKKVRQCAYACTLIANSLFFQMQAAEKKRPKEEKDIVQRLRPFARLQTAEDFEVFAADILCKV
jgi:transcriptional adapter 2-alpha